MAKKPTYEELKNRVQELEELVSIQNQQSKEGFRRFAENLPDMIYRISLPEGRYDYVSSAAEELFGFSPEAWYENPILIRDIIHPEWHAYFNEQWDRLLKGILLPTYEYKIIHKEKGDRWINQRNAAIRDEQGHLVAIEGLATDITERKKAEDTLKETERKLLDAQQLANLGFWFWDIHSGHVEWSDEVFKIFRLNPDEFKPQIESILALSPWPEDYQRDKELIRIVSENHEPGTYEQKFLFPDGSKGYYHSTFQGIYNERDNLVAIKGTVQDITAKKNAEEEQKKLENQLAQAQKMESVGRLAGGVAHDFNNMLSIILGNLEIVMEDIDRANPLVKNLEEVHRAAERSTNLTRQLLAFARKQTISPKCLQLNRIVEGMLTMLKRLIGEDIDVSWLPGKKLWEVKMDPSQVDQILANLCVNARDAIKSVGKVTIETNNISFDESYCRKHAGFIPGNYVMMAVSDNGSGMDKTTLENLFEPFYTTKDVGQGSGLGLATVYGTVKQNNGFINVYSEPDIGTTIKIYLPQYIQPVLQEQETTNKEIARTGNETILLVEDEKAILDMTKMMLERLGYSVLAASNPSEAIKIVEAYNDGVIHLLMTDVVMPEMNGRDLSIKLISVYPKLKCLFMSGYTANVIAHHGVLDTGVQFINKPFSKHDLANKVREVLDEVDGSTLL